MHNVQDILFFEFFRWLNSELNLDLNWSIKFNDNKRPTLISPNLVDHAGIFALAVQEVEVDLFGFNFDETTGQFWASVSLTYKSFSGGSNGMEIGNIWYNPESGWTFESAKQRFMKNQR